MTTMDMAGQVKQAELLSSIGAGFIGSGVALLVPSDLTRQAVPLLAIGLASHAVGMSRKHSLEMSEGSNRPRWAGMLYWACWLILAGLALWVGFGTFKSGSGKKVSQ